MIRHVEIGLGEAALPNQGLEPEHVGPGVRRELSLPGSLPAIDDTGHILTTMKDAVELGTTISTSPPTALPQLVDGRRRIQDHETMFGSVTKRESWDWQHQKQE